MKNYRIFVVPKQPVTDQNTDQAVNGQITVPSYLFGAFLACISTHSDGRNLPKHFMWLHNCYKESNLPVQS